MFKSVNLIYVFIFLFTYPRLAYCENSVLDDLIKKALSQYPSVVSKQTSKDAARTDLLASKLKFLPSASILASQNQVSSTSSAVSNNSSSLTYSTFAVSLPVFSGGATVAGYHKAESLLTASEYGVLEAEEDVAKRVVNAYGDWYKAYSKIKALEMADKEYAKFVQLINLRYESGVSSKSEIDLAVSRLNQNRVDLFGQKSLLSNALNTLNQLVGEDFNQVLLTENMPKYLELPTRDDVLSQAIEVSNTLNRMRAESEAAKADAIIARAQSFPQVSLQAQKQNGNQYVANQPGISSIGFVVQYNTDSGFATVASSMSAYTRAQATATNIETSKKDLIEHINSDYTEYEFSKLKSDTLYQADKLNAKLIESYSRQYLAGKKSWIDLMNGVREMTQTKVTVVDMEASLLTSSWRLFISINAPNYLEN